MRYEGPVELLTTGGAPLGEAHADLWMTTDPEPAVRWGGHLFPRERARQALTNLHAKGCEILLRLPSQQVGRVCITDPSPGWHRLVVDGLGEPPFPATPSKPAAP
jgi:hypothetical protein